MRVLLNRTTRPDNRFLNFAVGPNNGILENIRIVDNRARADGAILADYGRYYLHVFGYLRGGTNESISTDLAGPKCQLYNVR